MAERGTPLAYASGPPQGLRGEEILDGEGGKRKEVSLSSLYLLFAFLFCFPLETPHTQAKYTLLGTLLRNQDGDDNENVNKAIFVHFFAVTARLRRENA